MFQDSKGNYWFGSRQEDVSLFDGISSYDGKKIITHTTIENGVHTTNGVDRTMTFGLVQESRKECIDMTVKD